MNNIVLGEDEECVLKLVIKDYEARMERCMASVPFKGDPDNRQSYINLKSKLGMY